MKLAIGIGAFAVALAATLAMPAPGRSQLGPQAPCSVFDTRGCTPSVCSVFDDSPCVPAIPYPFSQDLRLTVKSRAHQHAAPAQTLNTIRELFDALEACWDPPAADQSQPGTEITIRFSLTRGGQVIGEPRYTYSTPALPDDVKSAYQRAVAAALARCTPLPLSAGLGGAIAGRPISTRFIDDRDLRTEKVK